jgi:hypothetical protein
MASRLLACMTLASLFLCFAQQDRNRNPNPACIDVEIAARRNSRGMVEIDGKVRNSGKQTVRKVKLSFLFVAPDGKVVSKRQAELETPVLAPGDEAEVLLETPDVARAVELRVEADRDGAFLEVRKGATVPIE